ncbi:MAG: hypothetical protein U0791_02035 [Gemmataceae bacterium]
MNIRGLQVGGSTTITVDGDDLGKAPKLLLPFPAKQTLQPKSTEKQATFEVTLDGTVPPGLHHLRVVSDGGVSVPVIIGVDKLPQKALTKDTVELPVAIHGSVNGSTVAEVTFNGKAKQRILVEVEAERLGSKLRPVVHLYSPKKLQLAWSWPVPHLLGDTRLEATLPEDGTYSVSIHDAEYAGQSPGFFRLKIGQWNYADRVFPPIAGADTKHVELVGNANARLDLDAKREPFAPLPWPTEGDWSGLRPFVETGLRPELTSGDSLAGMLKVGSYAVTDRFTKPFEESRFRIPAAPNSKMKFEVFAERLGSPLDVALVIRDEKDNVLARAEDGPGTLDPVLEYAVPDKTTTVIVGVVETQGRVGPLSAFRLAVDPAGANAAPDVRLFTPTSRLAIPAGGKWVVPVFADRKSYFGAVSLSPGGTIAADADGTLLTLGGTMPEAVIQTWSGRGDGLARPVFVKGHPLEKHQPWLATEIALAPTSAKAADFTVDWRGLPDTAGLVPLGRLALPVKVTRLDPAAPVRLTLLTSQKPPLVNNQPDVNKSIRPEKPVELGAKLGDGELVALLPDELPASSYDIAVQAELLSADKQRVLATAFTSVKKLPVRLPLAVKLVSPPKIEAKLDPKMPTAVEIKGEIVRSEGFAGEATASLFGLPPGIALPNVVVKANEMAFTIKLAVPPTATPGEFPLKLSVNAATNPMQPGLRVKSRDVPLVMSIVK